MPPIVPPAAPPLHPNYGMRAKSGTNYMLADENGAPVQSFDEFVRTIEHVPTNARDGLSEAFADPELRPLAVAVMQMINQLNHPDPAHQLTADQLKRYAEDIQAMFQVDKQDYDIEISLRRPEKLDVIVRLLRELLYRKYSALPTQSEKRDFPGEVVLDAGGQPTKKRTSSNERQILEKLLRRAEEALKTHQRIESRRQWVKKAGGGALMVIGGGTVAKKTYDLVKWLLSGSSEEDAIRSITRSFSVSKAGRRTVQMNMQVPRRNSPKIQTTVYVGVRGGMDSVAITPDSAGRVVVPDDIAPGGGEVSFCIGIKPAEGGKDIPEQFSKWEKIEVEPK